MPMECTFVDGEKRTPANPRLRHVCVAVLAFGAVGDVNEGKILLTRRAPTMAIGAGKVTVPGGYLKAGHTVVQCAVEEFAEETGYEIDPNSLELACVTDDPDRNDGDRQNVVFIFVTKVRGQPTKKPDDEQTEQLWVRPDDLPASMAFNYASVIGHVFKNGIKSVSVSQVFVSGQKEA